MDAQAESRCSWIACESLRLCNSSKAPFGTVPGVFSAGVLRCLNRAFDTVLSVEAFALVSLKDNIPVLMQDSPSECDKRYLSGIQDNGMLTKDRVTKPCSVSDKQMSLFLATPVEAMHSDFG